MVTVGGTKSYECTIAVNYIFHKELQIIGSNSATKHDLEVMMPLLGKGKLKTDHRPRLSRCTRLPRRIATSKSPSSSARSSCASIIDSGDAGCCATRGGQR